MNVIKRLLRPLHVPIYNWLKKPKRYDQLFTTIAIRPSRTILEVGTWNGNRAIEMIEAAKRAGVHDVRYVGFDLFEAMDERLYTHEISKKPPTRAEVETKLAETGAHVTLYAGNTLETLPIAVRTLPPVDFAYIDGGHSLETIANDWKYVSQLMHPGTHVIFDDYWEDRVDGGAKPIVDGIDAKRYRVEILPVCDRFDNTDFGQLTIRFARVSLR